MRQASSSRSRTRRALLATMAFGVGALIQFSPATASHETTTLAGSTFEIDANANLKVDHPSGTVDWFSLAHPSGPELRATDLPTGQNDNSYKGGAKEDTQCPDETTGSIPNNKSDLLTFHVFQEPGTGAHPGFLNLAWSRVSDPSGTTLMDFEFNQSTTDCSAGPNVVRTAGDLLIEYAITQGGARADITAREWTGTAWGPTDDLDESTACGGGPCATGTINSSVIPSGEADGLGEKQPRTFGEAQIDLRLIFDDEGCESFGSAMLKSRSSDAFNSQLKDFIAPVPIDLQNCGNVIIRKQTDPAQNPTTGPQFGFTKNFTTDPASTNTFTLRDDGVKDYDDTVLFGTGYTVTEDVLPSGWDFFSVNCSASTGVTPSISGATVTFSIDAATDVLDCTYTNRARGTIIVEKITDDGSGSFSFTSNTLTPSPFTLTTTAAGAAGKDSETFSNLNPGTYDVAETVPAGWNLVSGTCDDLSDPSSIDLAGGETVTCTFHDARQTGAIKITKTRKHAAAVGGEGPHAGVTFTVTGGELPAAGVSATTDANGVACVDGLVLSSFFAAGYTVTETVPAGYVVTSDNPQTVSVTAESECGDGNEAPVGFTNMPLTDVSISVDSQVAGGTSSTIECKEGSDVVGSAGPGDDITLPLDDLQPVTLVCAIVIDP